MHVFLSRVAEWRDGESLAVYNDISNPVHLFMMMRGVYGFLGLRLPISQPQRLNVFTTFGVTAAVNGTRRKMKLL